MITIGLLAIVVSGAGIFAILFVHLVSNRVLSRLGALIVFAVGMIIGIAVFNTFERKSHQQPVDSAVHQE